MNLAVLMTCHNRRETTLRCLDSLRAAMGEVNGSGGPCRGDIFLVDDGSTDGTDKAVTEWFAAHPEAYLNLRLIPGTGNLFWARGMELAWMMAVDAELQSASPVTNPQPLTPSHQPPATNRYTHFFWLNDDTILSPAAFALLRLGVEKNPHAVIVGGLTDESTGAKICGLRFDGLFTGNFVLIPHFVYDRVGMICGEYRHAWADSDYALQCKRAGVEVVELENVGTTQAHDLRPSLVGLNWRQRWHMLFDPKGWCLQDLWRYRRRNWGRCAAIGSCAHMIVHVLCSNAE